MSTAASSGDLVAAAARDLADVAAALARPEREAGERLLTLVVLARAARTADEATFALLDERADAANPNLLRYPYRVFRSRKEKLVETLTYTVPGMHCGHCKHAVREELSSVEGVESVDVDLETKLVTVVGSGLDDPALRAAIDEAGYEAA